MAVIIVPRGSIFRGEIPSELLVDLEVWVAGKNTRVDDKDMNIRRNGGLGTIELTDPFEKRSKGLETVIGLDFYLCIFHGVSLLNRVSMPLLQRLHLLRGGKTTETIHDILIVNVMNLDTRGVHV
jgi:hypothetical protein